MTRAFRCRCGRVAGEIVDGRDTRLMVCYCNDCQAYAHALGKADEMLDECGGTLVLGVRPRQLQLNRGREVLCCLSLTSKGLLRWYAGCCGTPIANTMRNPRIAHVGLLHTCLSGSRSSVESSYGPVRMRGFVKHATQPPVLKASGTFAAVLGLAASLLHARLTGSYRITPFFDSAGNPVVLPRVLSTGELKQARMARAG